MERNIKLTFREYTDLLIRVFGPDAKIGIEFIMLMVKQHDNQGKTGDFPILSISGKKASGKTALANSLLALCPDKVTLIDNVERIPWRKKVKKAQRAGHLIILCGQNAPVADPTLPNICSIVMTKCRYSAEEALAFRKLNAMREIGISIY